MKKLEIPILGTKDEQPVIDGFFENICRLANVNIDIIIGRPSKVTEQNCKIFILIKDKIRIKYRYDITPQEVLDIYPSRPKKVLIHFIEINIDEDKLDLLTEEEYGLVKNE